ncbi:MAG: CvpA family protein [Dehalococcoidales bacterium]
MNWLDIVLIVGLILSVIIGFKVGAIKGLFLLAGVIIGVVLAGRYSDDLALKLTFISDLNIAGVVAFVIILVATILVALILAFIIERIAHWALLGWLDSWGGAILGLLLGGIFLGAILAMLLKYQGGVTTISGSALAKFLLDQFRLVLGLLPSEFQGIHLFFY